MEDASLVKKTGAPTRERLGDASLVKKTGAPTRERLEDISLVKKTGAPTRERLRDAILSKRLSRVGAPVFLTGLHPPTFHELAHLSS